MNVIKRAIVGITTMVTLICIFVMTIEGMDVYAASVNNSNESANFTYVSEETHIDSSSTKTDTKDIAEASSENINDGTPNTADAAKIFLVSIITIMSLAVVAAIIIKKVRT